MIAGNNTLSFDPLRMLEWIDQIFGTISDKMHAIGRKALKNLIVHNKHYLNFLQYAIDECLVPDRPKALESYLDVVHNVLSEHEEYPLPFWRVLGMLLVILGNDKATIRAKSARLLRVLEERQQKSSRLQDFDISISDGTTAVYKLAQYQISERLANQHSSLALFVFSQFSLQFKNTHAENQRNMVAVILPWIKVIELELEPNGGPTPGPTPQTYMVLVNLLEMTTRLSNAFHNEVQAFWQALSSGPHGGNVQLILEFVIELCIERKEQSFVDYAKQIVVHLSGTPAGQKVIDFLLLQITPRSMVHSEKAKRPTRSNSTNMPYVADIAEALPSGNKQVCYYIVLNQVCTY